MVNQEFSVDGRPPINFTLKVIATDLPVKDPNFKAKIVFDFVPTFTPELKADTPNFHANKVYRLMNFITQRVIKKVIEWVYFDRGIVDNVKELPEGYESAIRIYDERLAIKAKLPPGDLSYLDHREERETTPKGDCIEDIVSKFFNNEDRPVWAKESNVTRITFEELSPSTITVDTRTAINGDKRPK